LPVSLPHLSGACEAKIGGRQAEQCAEGASEAGWGQPIKLRLISAPWEIPTPSQGVLTVSVKVPESCGVQGQRNSLPITVEYGGELIGSELWSCMKSATEQELKRIELPACIYQWGAEWRLEFPHPKLDLSGARD
jgi:hypothetical protein